MGSGASTGVQPVASGEGAKSDSTGSGGPKGTGSSTSNGAESGRSGSASSKEIEHYKSLREQLGKPVAGRESNEPEIARTKEMIDAYIKLLENSATSGEFST